MRALEGIQVCARIWCVSACVQSNGLIKIQVLLRFKPHRGASIIQSINHRHQAALTAYLNARTQAEERDNTRIVNSCDDTDLGQAC